MASAKEIQDRMRSIKDTLKITNAMYMIQVYDFFLQTEKIKKNVSGHRAVFLYPSV